MLRNVLLWLFVEKIKEELVEETATTKSGHILVRQTNQLEFLEAEMKKTHYFSMKRR